MGQKTSHPTEKLQYEDRIICIDRNKFTLYNIDTNLVEATHEIHTKQMERGDWLKHLDKKLILIKSIGNKDVMIVYKPPPLFTDHGGIMISIIPSLAISAFVYVAFLDKKWKPIKTSWIETSESPTQFLLTRLLQNKIPHEETDIPVDFKIEDKYVIININNEVSSIIPKSHTAIQIIAMTYCKYDKCVILCLKCDANFSFERWDRDETKVWKCTKENHHHKFRTVAVKINYISCSKNYLLIDLQDMFDNAIVILNKDTFAENVVMAGRCGPVFRDDYGFWFAKNIELLKNVKVLNKITSDVLKIILSYVA